MAKTSKQNKEIKRLLDKSRTNVRIVIEHILRTDLSLQKNSKEIWL